MTIADYRHFYAQELRFAANLKTPGLVEAFARVAREKFLGPGPWEIASAEQRALSAAGITGASYTPIHEARDLYHNVVVVIDKARDINNGQPSALARWIDAMDLRPGARAYHAGCGVGYYTAIMAELVGTSGTVAAADLQADLAERARANLVDYANVTVHAGDAARIDPGECDAMLINAGVHRLPALWLDRLADGGRLVAPFTITMTPTIGQGLMVKIVRRGGRYSAEMVTPLAICSCGSLRDPESDAAIKRALSTGALLKLKSLRRDAHEPCETCLLHGAEMCISAAEA
jgi:protein-L-isoaspartate(D-aspartate) O-methyltransferase